MIWQNNRAPGEWPKCFRQARAGWTPGNRVIEQVKNDPILAPLREPGHETAPTQLD